MTAQADALNMAQTLGRYGSEVRERRNETLGRLVQLDDRADPKIVAELRQAAAEYSTILLSLDGDVKSALDALTALEVPPAEIAEALGIDPSEFA